MNLNTFPSFAIPILLNKLDFEVFANTFNVWRHGKDRKTQQTVLRDTDLVRFFQSAGWEPQFLPFIHFAANMDVLDAMFYTPCCMLFGDHHHTKTAAMMMKILAEEGHVLSKFTFSVFSLFHIPEFKEESMQNLLDIVKSPGMSKNIPNWISILSKMSRTWHPFSFDYRVVAGLCDKHNQKNCYKHFDEKSWPILINELGDITCLACKVAVVLYNFCDQV